MLTVMLLISIKVNGLEHSLEPGFELTRDHLERYNNVFKIFTNEVHA